MLAQIVSQPLSFRDDGALTQYYKTGYRLTYIIRLVYTINLQCCTAQSFYFLWPLSIMESLADELLGGFLDGDGCRPGHVLFSCVLSELRIWRRSRSRSPRGSSSDPEEDVGMAQPLAFQWMNLGPRTLGLPPDVFKLPLVQPLVPYQAKTSTSYDERAVCQFVLCELRCLPQDALAQVHPPLLWAWSWGPRTW